MMAPTAGPVGLVLSKLHGVKGNGAGFKALCPGHDDRKASLSIGEGVDGEALVYCFAGCGTPSILDKIDLTMRDLFPVREGTVRKSPPRADSRTPGKITRYEVQDVTGKHTRVHGREDHPNGEKSIWWERSGGIRGLGGIKLADLKLYGIDRLQTDGVVIVTEGEKAADALLSNNIPAVGTVTGASGTPGDDTLRPLLSRPVYLWPDNDDQGRKHMQRIGAALLRLGHRDLRSIDWKDAPDKGDAADLVSLEAWRDEYDAILDKARKIEGPKPLFESLSTLLLHPRTPRWLVYKLIETPSTVLLFSPSGTGKSFLAVDLASSAATNGKWYGRNVISSGPVFYIVGEGKIGLLRRFHAWEIHNGVTLPKDRIFISATRITLDEGGGARAEKEIEELSTVHGTPSLIVIDTLARALPSGANENTGQDTGPFINIVDRIRDRFDCVALVIHHAGHQEQKRARGFTGIKAAMDAELCISGLTGIRLAEWTKMKDLEEPPPMGFNLKQVVLGVDEDGEDITSCVVEWKGQAAIKTGQQITDAESLGLKTLRTAIMAHDGAVDANTWRPHYYEEHTGDNDDTKRKAFARVRASMAKKKLVRMKSGCYSLNVF